MTEEIKLSQQQGGYWGPAYSWGKLLDQAAEIIPDQFVLINLISKRVKQLNSGRSPLIATRPSMSTGRIALAEFIEGKLRWVEG